MLNSETFPSPPAGRSISFWKNLFLSGMVLTVLAQTGVAEEKKSAAAKKEKKQWVSLFDGKSLKGWEITKFGGEGDVEVKDKQLILGMGADMTGAHTKQKVPRSNYEIEWDAMRVEGSDFFCALTFPVKKKYCSLILGGWGGGVCGLSSIDRQDASENETTSYRKFDNKKWYKVRLRVMDDRIQAWIDKEQIIDQGIKDRVISVRIEVELSQPLGFSTWQTTGALKNIRIRKLSKQELQAEAKK